MGALFPALVYAVFAALWILVSDRVVTLLFRDPVYEALANTLKGWLFVAVTALLLYLLLRRRGRAEEGLSMAPAEPTRVLSWPVLAILGVILAVTAGGIASTMAHKQQEAEARLHAIADLKSSQISDWLRERLGDAKFIQSSAFFAEQYGRWSVRGDEAARERLTTRLEQLRNYRGFSAVSLLDPTGKRIWGTDQAPERLAPPLLEAVAHGWDGQIHRVGPYVGVAGNRRLDFLVPLPVSEGLPPMVVLHVDPAAWLYPMLQTWPVISASGETLLFRRDGDRVQFLNDLRHRREAAVTFRLPVTNAELLAAQVLNGHTDMMEMLKGVDYRGVPVLGMVRAISGTDWYLVAKVDRAEVYAESFRDAVWMGLTGTLALFIILASLLLLRQRHRLAVAEHARQAETERVRALKLLEAFAESSDDAIFAKDLEGRYMLFNRAAGLFVGKPVEEVIGRDDHSLFPPEQAEQVMALDRQAILENRIHTSEEMLDTPQGRRIFLATKGPLRDENDQVIGTFGISRDITESRLAEDQLADQMRRFHLLLDSSRDGIVILDQDHQVMEANQRFAEMLGYGPQELPGLHTWDFDALQNEAEIRAGFPDLSHTRRVFETRHRRKDGSEYDVEVSASGAVWGGQNLVLCICRDITERKRAEAQLRLWATAFDKAEFAVAIADAHTNVFQAVNPAFARERGYAPAELVGQPIFTVYPEDMRGDIKAKVDALDLVGHGIFESEHQRRDGSRFPVLMDITLIHAPNGEPVARMAYALDITERKRAEAAIRESETRFRALVEQSLAGIYIIQDGRFRYVNPGFAAIFGYRSPEDLAGMPTDDLVATEDRERVSEHVRRRVDGEITDIHYVFKGLRRDGSAIDVEVHGRAFDFEGRPAVIGMILDITDRKAAEDALRESELRFHDIVNASADWVWEVDAQGRYTYASESVQDLLGYSAAEIVGKTPFEFMPAEEGARLKALFAEIAARKAPFRDLDNINLHKDGSLRYILTNGMPILDEAGNLMGYRGLDRDVTERRLAEIALRESEARWIMAIDSAGHGVWDWNNATNKVFYSPTWKTMLGYAEDEIGDSLEEWTGRVHPQEKARCQAELERHLRGETDTYICEHRVRCKDGAYKWILDQGRVVARDVHGKPTRVIGTHTDISHSKAAEEELRRQSAELAERNAELERFNRATVGRELDMIELKKQINALSRELGQTPPFDLSFARGAGQEDTP